MKTYLKGPWINFEGNTNPRNRVTHFTSALLSKQLGCRRTLPTLVLFTKCTKKKGLYNITHNRMQKETKENQVKKYNTIDKLLKRRGIGHKHKPTLLINPSSITEPLILL
jgi:hypothetical protein